MSVGLKFNGNQMALLNVRLAYSEDISITFNLKINSLPILVNEGYLMRGDILNPASYDYFACRLLDTGELVVRCGGGQIIATNTPIGSDLAIEIRFTGLSPVSGTQAGVMELFFNGISQGTATPRANPFISNQIRAIGSRFNSNDANQSYDDIRMTLYSLNIIATDYTYTLSAAASDTISTGSQPILVDTTSGNNAIGQRFPTDGTAWDDGAPPAQKEITTSSLSASPSSTINYNVSLPDGPITQARLTRGTAVLTLTSVTNASAVVPALADGLNVIPFGTDAQLELWDGTEWLTAPIEFTQPVGHGYVTLAGTLNTSETGFLFNYGGTPAVGDQFVNTNTDLTLAANGNITSDVDGTYTVYAIDVSDTQPVLEAFTVTLAEAADTTAPTLTNGSATPTQTTASISVTTDEGNGTLYYLVNSQTSATVAAVKAGSNQAVTATGVQNISQTGLTASTQYYAHIVHTDAAGNDSAVTTIGFTTLAVVVDGTGIISISTNTITGGDPFTIGLSNVNPLEIGESWKAFIKIGDTIFPLVVGTVSLNTVELTASVNLPTTLFGQAELILSRSKIIIMGSAASESTDELLSRGNHTGTQPLSSIEGAGDLAGLNTNSSTANYLRGDGTWVTPPNTTYSEITTEEIDAGTSATLRTITGRRIKHALDKKTDVGHGHAVGEISGLGTAATRDATTSPTDTTAGRVTKVGDFGSGGWAVEALDLNTISGVGGIYKFDSSTINKPIPNGVLFHAARTNDIWGQLVISRVGTGSELGRAWIRAASGTANEIVTKEIYTTGNLNTLEFGGSGANSLIGFGGVATSTIAQIYLPANLSLAPSSISVAGTFALQTIGGTVIQSGIGSGSISISASAKSPRWCVLNVTSNGLTINDTLKLVAESTSSKITVNP